MVVYGKKIYIHVFSILASCLFLDAIAANLHGFNIDNSLVSPDEIYFGGPQKDAIPALEAPTFITVEQATYLDEQDRVIGIHLNGISKAYPIKILNYHEVINDQIASENILVTYCPLCGSGVAFNLSANDSISFGVSGLLYNSDLLFYDRGTESLWSQLLGLAIAGPLMGQRLTMMPITHTTWEDWKKKYPDSYVLSNETGYWRDYDSDPYINYSVTSRLYFPVNHWDKRYHPKEIVVGLILNGRYKAYPFSELSKQSDSLIDYFAGEEIRLIFDSEHRTGKIFNAIGEELPSTIAYWFAWMTFYPRSDVFQAE